MMHKNDQNDQNGQIVTKTQEEDREDREDREEKEEKNNSPVYYENGSGSVSTQVEKALNYAKNVDDRISRQLYRSSYLSKIPLANKFFQKPIRSSVLSQLEKELKESINQCVNSLGYLGKEITKEREKLDKLREIQKTAKEEEWNYETFISFIEENTDIDFLTDIDGQRVDIKQFMVEANEYLEVSNEKVEEYHEWLANHIETVDQSLSSMITLSYISSKWIDEMSKNYFDISQFRQGMEQTQETLRSIAKGGMHSVSTQDAIREYSHAHVRGMQVLVSSLEQSKNHKGQFDSSKLESELENLKKRVKNSSGKLTNSKDASTEKQEINAKEKVRNIEEKYVMPKSRSK